MNNIHICSYLHVDRYIHTYHTFTHKNHNHVTHKIYNHKLTYIHLVGGLEHVFPFSWEFHNPNWGVETTNQS